MAGAVMRSRDCSGVGAELEADQRGESGAVLVLMLRPKWDLYPAFVTKPGRFGGIRKLTRFEDQTFSMQKE
jgi:hypothetical protein